ncbi:MULTISPECIES: 2-thiouracil desulfurase family protein [Hafnia]|jgi:uncharacterized protein YbbK (DUF523 family)|uniref:DUF523 domain-containing protein n=1 Tax=Hafnia TaxID=568 RepID=UPI000BB56074|nr:DUF523 domain-containing protein [Hafnia paralvei]MBU2671372.1 DUF523 domain-containing protein [Hafnia paralvei]MBW2959846.1 DUF523 domain-containing protein [Hafnia paralvei]MCE9878812.1 DUF523 domain-containing protein [Hafnia paralvei]MCE9908870.1 DUF523 domain-containing protein [Hafnia paralvei]MCE9948830.1 DUF523 domain-containing protein [Hafnia paralvei]
MTNPTKILVSTCLMGFPVRYNGSAKPFMPPTLLRWQQEDRLILCCPEVSAGFPTPRLSAEIRYSPLGERAVVESDNNDVTAGYLAGASIALQLALKHQCRFALLTDGSPSCGSSLIYDGSFSGKKISGMGLTADLLRKNGITVFSEAEFSALEAAVTLSDRQTAC